MGIMARVKAGDYSHLMKAWPSRLVEFAAKKRKAGAKKEDRGTKDSPKCKTGNYQCRGKKGVACIPNSKGCSTDLKNINPARRQYIEAVVAGLKAEGAKPKTARIGRKLGAPIVELTPEQYGKALALNISQLKLVRGDVTREQLKAIGVNVDNRKSIEKPTNDIVPLDGTRSAKARLNDETRPEVLREIAKNTDDPELQKAASELLRSMDATDKALGDMKGLTKPKTKLQQVVAEKDAALRLNPNASDFEMVDNSAIRGLGAGDPELANLIKRAGMAIKPSVLTPDGMGENGEMFRVVAGGDVADAAARAYREERSPQLELAAAIVTNTPESAKRQADLLAGDTGWSIPRGAMAPDLASLGGMVRGTSDTTASSRMFSFNHSDITAPKNSFDQQEIDSIAREILRTGGLVQPIPLVQTGRATAAADASFEPIAGFKAYAAAQRARELDPQGAEMFRGILVDPNNAAELDQVQRFYGATPPAQRAPLTKRERVQMKEDMSKAFEMLGIENKKQLENEFPDLLKGKDLSSPSGWTQLRNQLEQIQSEVGDLSLKSLEEGNAFLKASLLRVNKLQNLRDQILSEAGDVNLKSVEDSIARINETSDKKAEEAADLDWTRIQLDALYDPNIHIEDL